MWTLVRLLLATVQPCPAPRLPRPRVSSLWPSPRPPGSRRLSDRPPGAMEDRGGVGTAARPVRVEVVQEEEVIFVEERPAVRRKEPDVSRDVVMLKQHLAKLKESVPSASPVTRPEKSSSAATADSSPQKKPSPRSQKPAPTPEDTDRSHPSPGAQKGAAAPEDSGQSRRMLCDVAGGSGSRSLDSLKRKRQPSDAADAADTAANSRERHHSDPGKQRRHSRKHALSAEDMLESIRVWKPNPMFYQSHQPVGGDEFTVVSYNVLSQHLLETVPSLYRGAEPANTAWDARGPRLWRQITETRPDIVCLQEVEKDDVESFWRPRCKEEGLEMVYKKRTGANKRDGCAVLFRSAAFSLSESATVEYMQPLCRSLDRDNVGIVLRLRSRSGELVVACTHLLYNPKRHDVKLAQMALLLAEVDRLAWCGHRQTHLPVIVTGDFNLQPFTPVYEFLVRGWLQYGGFSRRLVPWSPAERGQPLLGPLLPPHLGVSALCQHAAVQQRRWAGRAESEPERRRQERRLVALQHSELRPAARAAPYPPPGPQEPWGCLGHGMRLGTVYRHGSPRKTGVTTKQGHWITVDYMFYSVSPPPGAARLQLLSRLELPSAAVCQRLRPCPSQALPSDHLPLAARFRLVPDDPRAAAARHGHW